MMMETLIKLDLSPKDLNLILISLGQLPYNQVHELIERIQAEAGPQLVPSADQGEKETKLKQVKTS